MDTARIAEAVRVRGFDVTPEEVAEFISTGGLSPSVIGDDYDEAREQALTEALGEVPSLWPPRDTVPEDWSVAE